jgi:hypothetical protein
MEREKRLSEFLKSKKGWAVYNSCNSKLRFASKQLIHVSPLGCPQLRNDPNCCPSSEIHNHHFAEERRCDTGEEAISHWFSRSPAYAKEFCQTSLTGCHAQDPAGPKGECAHIKISYPQTTA